MTRRPCGGHIVVVGTYAQGKLSRAVHRIVEVRANNFGALLVSYP